MLMILWLHEITLLIESIKGPIKVKAKIKIVKVNEK